MFRRILIAGICAIAFAMVNQADFADAQQRGFGGSWGQQNSAVNYNKFYHYPYVTYPQNYWGNSYYRSADSLYYRYPPEDADSSLQSQLAELLSIAPSLSLGASLPDGRVLEIIVRNEKGLPYRRAFFVIFGSNYLLNSNPASFICLVTADSIASPSVASFSAAASFFLSSAINCNRFLLTSAICF